MSKKQIELYDYDHTANKITIQGTYDLSDFVLIQNVTKKILLYTTEPPYQFSITVENDDDTTIITTRDVADKSDSGDELQIFINITSDVVIIDDSTPIDVLIDDSTPIDVNITNTETINVLIDDATPVDVEVTNATAISVSEALIPDTPILIYSAQTISANSQDSSTCVDTSLYKKCWFFVTHTASTDLVVEIRACSSDAGADPVTLQQFTLNTSVLSAGCCITDLPPYIRIYVDNNDESNATDLTVKMFPTR